MQGATDFAYRPPTWGIDPAQRAALQELVTEALEAFEPVAVTHDSDADAARRVRDGFAVREVYRPQLDIFKSIAPGEALADTAFAALQLRPRGSTEPVIGIPRYGEVVINWSSAALRDATIAPILSGTVGQARQFGAGLQAGTMDDLPEVLTDALIAQQSDVPVGLGTRQWLPELLARPRAEALDAVKAAFTHEHFRRLSPELILRGVTPTADSIDAVTILTDASTPELDAIRDWAQAAGIPHTVAPAADA